MTWGITNMTNEYAVYVVQGEGAEIVERYSRWTSDREYAEYSAEFLVNRISGTDSPVHTVRVLNRVGDQVWEMEVA